MKTQVITLPEHLFKAPSGHPVVLTPGRKPALRAAPQPATLRRDKAVITVFLIIALVIMAERLPESLDRQADMDWRAECQQAGEGIGSCQ